MKEKKQVQSNPIQSNETLNEYIANLPKVVDSDTVEDFDLDSAKNCCNKTK